jgi:hypothetical protein
LTIDHLPELTNSGDIESNRTPVGSGSKNLKASGQIHPLDLELTLNPARRLASEGVHTSNRPHHSVKEFVNAREGRDFGARRSAGLSDGWQAHQQREEQDSYEMLHRYLLAGHDLRPLLFSRPGITWLPRF